MNTTAQYLTYRQRKALRRLARGQQIPNSMRKDSLLIKCYDGVGDSIRISEFGKELAYCMEQTIYGGES